MNGAAAVQELQKIFKHKSLNDVSTIVKLFNCDPNLDLPMMFLIRKIL